MRERLTHEETHPETKPAREELRPIIVEYRKKLLDDEVKDAVNSIVADVIAEMEKPIEPEYVQFRKEFQKRYVECKLRYAMLYQDLKALAEFTPDFEKEDVDNIDLTGFSEAEKQKIMKLIHRYMKKRQEVQEFMDVYNTPEALFRALTGKKAQGNIIVQRIGGSILLLLEDIDFEVFIPGSWSGLFQKKLIYNVKKRKDQRVPILCVRQAIERLTREQAEDVLEEAYHEEMTGYWTELGEKRPDYDEWLREREQTTETYEEWRANFVLYDKPTGDVDYKAVNREKIDPETEEPMREHEFQHFIHSLTWVRDQTERLILATEQETRAYIREIFESYNTRLADETIAYAVNHELIPLTRRVNKQTGEKRISSLYFYPRFEKRRELGRIRRAIGEQRYSEWQVEEIWNSYAEKGWKKLLTFREIGDFILKSKNSGLRYLFEVEPVESWERLYRWLRRDPSLVALCEEKQMVW